MTSEVVISEYGAPLDQLINLGEAAARQQDWPDYLALGFTPEHIPQLIRLANDDRFDDLDSETTAVWAPLHAWRTLGQLRAEPAIETLVDLLWRADEDDWAIEDLPEAISRIGPPAVPALSEFLLDPDCSAGAGAAAGNALVKIAKAYPEAREACVSVLIGALERYEKNVPDLNGYLVCDLAADLHAVEALPVIREAYHRQCVELTMMGDLQDAEIALGVRTERTGPPRYPDLAEQLGLVKSKPKPPINWAQVGRNELCPCGSGIKFKKCCLKRVQSGHLR